MTEFIHKIEKKIDRQTYLLTLYLYMTDTSLVDKTNQRSIKKIKIENLDKKTLHGNKKSCWQLLLNISFQKC